MNLLAPLTRLRAYFRASVRAKLLFLVLAPLLIGFPLITGLIWYWSDTSYRQLMTLQGQQRSGDGAWIHGRRRRRASASVEALADGDRLRPGAARGDPVQIAGGIESFAPSPRPRLHVRSDAEGRVRHASAAQNSRDATITGLSCVRRWRESRQRHRHLRRRGTRGDRSVARRTRRHQYRADRAGRTGCADHRKPRHAHPCSGTCPR